MSVYIRQKVEEVRVTPVRAATHLSHLSRIRAFQNLKICHTHDLPILKLAIMDRSDSRLPTNLTDS